MQYYTVLGKGGLFVAQELKYILNKNYKYEILKNICDFFVMKNVV